MITKINAELDSVETAELAARMIKQRTGGILNISIKGNIDNNDYSDHSDTVFAPIAIANNSFGSAAMPISAFGGAFINLDTHSDNDSREISRAAVIEVICEKESEKTVTQVFTSLGGLKINKN